MATTAGSAPKNDTTVVTPAGDNGKLPGGTGYDGGAQGNGMGYGTPAP